MGKFLFKHKALNLTLAVIVLTFSLSGTAVAQATTTTTNQFIPFLQLASVPCANGGAGELVLISGILHVQTHLTIVNNRNIIKQHFQPMGATGLGLSTGDIYRAVGVTQFMDVFPIGGVGAVSSSVNNFRLIGRGPNNNLQVHQNIHFTINANGEFTAFVGNTSVVCN